MKEYEQVMNEMFYKMNIETGLRKSEHEELNNQDLIDFVWGEYGEEIMMELLGEVYGIDKDSDNFENCFRGYMDYIGYCFINILSMELLMMGLWWFKFMSYMNFNNGRKIKELIKKDNRRIKN